MSDKMSDDEEALCQLCGQPMAEGERMFNYHGYAGGSCPAPPLTWRVLDSYESLLLDAMRQANELQGFLWGDETWDMFPFDARDWAAAFQKRVDCIKAIDRTRPAWKVELRKRLLQQASLSLKAILALKNEGPDEQGPTIMVALNESLKLQRHYAGLLNMHDGGERIEFNSADEWIERLRSMGIIQEEKNEPVSEQISDASDLPADS